MHFYHPDVFTQIQQANQADQRFGSLCMPFAT
jgi:hypothetical protein